MMAVLWTVIAILFILLLFCAWRLIGSRYEALRLKTQIESFLCDETASPSFSVRDNDFALFENAVVELQTRLLRSQENARSESVGNQAFVQDVSHQLKTPIAGLRLYCEMDESEHKHQKLQLIERMETLIAALLKLEKLRSDGYAFEFNPCELHELALDARAQFLPLHPKKHIAVNGIASIRCDAYWIFEALTNLIKNACEHTAEEGHVTISIEQSDSEVMIRVEDDGGGVEPEALSRLFERFYRGGKSEGGHGVGLGLSIAKTIVKKHHGSIRAQNGEYGMCITIYLPMLHDLLKKT